MQILRGDNLHELSNSIFSETIRQKNSKCRQLKFNSASRKHAYIVISMTNLVSSAIQNAPIEDNDQTRRILHQYPKNFHKHMNCKYANQCLTILSSFLTQN